MTIAPSTSLGKLESNFCRDFSCCGQELGDLHDLLQHYEECHVRFDDDEMPGMIDDDDSTSSSGSISTPSSVPPSPRAANAKSAASAANKMTGLSAGGVSSDPKRRGLSLNINVGNAPGALESPSVNKAKKRSFGQYDATAGSVAPNNASVHQSLRRALIDGGVNSRSNHSTPSVYSANSPFSTPGSSIPGTPISDDHEFAFGGPSGLSAFSALSLRPSNVDDHLPACAPPNLFFPSPGSTSSGGSGGNATTPGLSALHLNNIGGTAPANGNSSQPPAKRERITSAGSTGPGGEKLDREGKIIEKPFKCPNPGCDKAYKQANGLKYHRLHGSCNRNLTVKAGARSAPRNPTQSNSKPPSASSQQAAPASSGSSSMPKLTQPPTSQAQSPTTPSANAVSSMPPVKQSVSTVNPSTSEEQQIQPVKPAAAAAAAQNALKLPNATKNSNGIDVVSPKSSLPLPAHINSAALAAAAALLQRGGPLPASLQGQNGPIDTASLLKTLQILQQQMVAQQGGNATAANGSTGLTGAPGNMGVPANLAFSASKGSVAPGAPTGAASATIATSSGGSTLSKTAPAQQMSKLPTAANITGNVQRPNNAANASGGPLPPATTPFPKVPQTTAPTVPATNSQKQT